MNLIKAGNLSHLKSSLKAAATAALMSVLGAGLVTFAGAAQAAPTTLYFSGTFTAVVGAQAAVLNGQAFSGSLSYDSGRVPDYTGGNYQDYRLGAGAMAVSTALGSGSTSGVGTLRQVWNASLGTALNGNFVGDSFSASDVATFRSALSIFDHMGLTLADDARDADDPLGVNLSALPTSFVLSEFNATEFRVGNLTDRAFGSVACLSTSATACSAGTTAVPEPGTLALCLVSFVGLAAVRRR